MTDHKKPCFGLRADGSIDRRDFLRTAGRFGVGAFGVSNLGLASLAQAQQQDAPSKPAKQQALPLDHGPHAQVTPWVNQQKRQQAAAAAKAKPAAQDKS